MECRFNGVQLLYMTIRFGLENRKNRIIVRVHFQILPRSRTEK